MAQLVCIEGLKQGLMFEIEGDEATLGRGVMNSIILPHHSVSRKHATIKKDDSHFILTDLNSLNGTFVNEQKIATTLLQNGDVLKFGDLLFGFKSSSGIEKHDTLVSMRLPEVKLICREGMEQGVEIKLEGETVQAGRGKTNEITLLHKSISRDHCRFSMAEGRVVLKDLGSTNGSFVNGKRIQEQELSDNDEIKLGDLLFTISITRPVEDNDTRLFDKSGTKMATLVRDDFSSLDLAEVEKSLIFAEVQAHKPAVLEANEKAPEIAAKVLLDRTLSIETERQGLLLIFQASKALMSILRLSDFQQKLSSTLKFLFNFENMLLIVDINETPKVLSKQGNIPASKLNQILSQLFFKGSNTININPDSKMFDPFRQIGAAKAIMLAPIISNGKRIGVFYLDSNQPFIATDQQFFEMFAELLSLSVRNTLQVEVSL